MRSPQNWTEPGQSPTFDEYTLVLKGEVHIEQESGEIVVVKAGEAFHASAGSWIRYGTPDGAEYIAICTPAFSPDTVHRDES